MKDYSGMIDIHGDLFEFDSLREYIILHGHPEKRFKLSDLDRGFEYLRGMYETEEKIMIPYSRDDGISGEFERFRSFTIPLPVIEHGYQLTAEVLQDYNQESLKERKGYQYVTGELSERLNGKLPEMKIDGVDYVVDLKNLEIWQKENPELRFVFSKSALHEPTELFYNTRTKMPVILSHRISEYPLDVICFIFPKLRTIDLIGYNQLKGYPPTSDICDYQWNLKDFNVPWKGLDQTNIPELVRRNQIEQERQGRKNPQDSASRKKYRKGL